MTIHFDIFARDPKQTADLRREFKGQVQAGLLYFVWAAAFIIWMVIQFGEYWQFEPFRNSGLMLFLAGAMVGVGLMNIATLMPWTRSIREPEERFRS